MTRHHANAVKEALLPRRTTSGCRYLIPKLDGRREPNRNERKPHNTINPTIQVVKEILPTPKLDELSAGWDATHDVVGMGLENFDFGIGEIIFVQEGNLFKQFESFFCDLVRLSSVSTVSGVTIIEQQRGQSLAFAVSRMEALEDGLQQGGLGLVTSNINDISLSRLKRSHFARKDTVNWEQRT